jgi:hypothetical protein
VDQCCKRSLSDESAQKIGRFTVLREPWQEPSEALAAKLARLKDTVAKLASDMDRLRAIERAMPRPISRFP